MHASHALGLSHNRPTKTYRLRVIMAVPNIASNWKALSGTNNWEDLLDPIDNNLRRYLIHYSTMPGAVGESLNEVSAAKSYRLPRFPPEEFFIQAGLQNGNPFKYQVTKYFYTQSEVKIGTWINAGESAWMGLVAVTTDEGNMVMGRRDIMVCWRGTCFPIEWFKDIEFNLTSASDLFGDTNSPMVHYGFKSVYTKYNSDTTYSKASARTQVLNEIRKLVDLYATKGEEVSITVVGHSLGSALATLNATDIVANGYNIPTGSKTGFPVTCFATGSPQVGNSGFQAVVNGLSGLHLLRIKNSTDWVPKLPQSVDSKYVDVGLELEIDSTTSPYLKADISAHDLNLYLHTIAGYKGNGEEFKLVVDHDIALLNKHQDALLTSYKVPPTWFVVKNYGMIQMDNGFWKMIDYFLDPPTDVEEEEEDATSSK